MPSPQIPQVDLRSLQDATPAGSYARGQRYARTRAVSRMRWDGDEGRLTGTVRGSGGSVYSTIAFLAASGERPLRFDRGVCSCPVGFDCKHVVALVLTAAQAAARPVVPARPATAPPIAPPVRPAWETSVAALLRTGAPAGQAAVVQSRLAVELSLAESPGLPRPSASSLSQAAPRLMARLVQPGVTGWVAAQYTWPRLDTLAYYRECPAEHAGLLSELYALYLARSGRGFYYYGDDRYLDLSAFESPRLWQLLGEMRAAGLRLVYPRRLGDVPAVTDAELCLDVTGTGADPGSLTITPRITIDGQTAGVTPVRFVGSEGHGLVYVDPSEVHSAAPGGASRFRLARLVSPAPPALQEMVLSGASIEVPATERARFSEAYYPGLRQVATVVSSDGAFSPPELSGPTLVLRAAYSGEHEVRLSWEWSYQVGDTERRLAADPGDYAAYRDLPAERALLAGLALPAETYGLMFSGAAGPALCQQAVTLDGIDTMRFTTGLLPLLAEQPGVRVDVTGEPADYREAGDSLQVAVSSDPVAGDTDWFDLGITITVDGQSVPFAEVFTALTTGQQYLLLPDGAYFSLEKPELQALAELIREARALRDAPPGELRLSRFQASLWEELTQLGIVVRQARAWQEQVEGLLSVHSVERTQPPPGLVARLRPYQLDGFSWLAFLWEHGLGGILADDMGLGKTLQSLALLTHARASDPAAPPFLVVAPTSVVPNWAAEAERFAPGLRVAVITETQLRSGRPLAELVEGADAVVTSYTLLRIDFSCYAALSWSGLILDEAQFAKNHQSRIYQCARRLQAPFKLAITGTPLENNLMELWSLLSITAPGLFPDPARFREFYARPIERQRSAELLAQFRRRIRPLVKRRTKEQVAADLPPKQEQVLEVDLHPRHRKIYQTHLQRERQKVLGLIDDLDANRFTIFRSLTLLRQLSLHAGLVADEHIDQPSSKIDLLVSQLGDVVSGGHRALVFSQFTGFLALVREQLDLAGIAYCYLDGSTRDRSGVIGRFKRGDAPVFLISLKAGGFGLNLTEADYCFLLDPWWNPATEAQAVDRAHRIGQERKVMVYRLISRDTIEQKVMELAARKAELFASVLDDGNVFGASIGADDIRGLFA